MTTSQQKLLPWLSNLVTKTIDQGLPVLPEVLFICRKQFRKSLFVSQGQVRQNHFPFSILFLLCCSLLCSALLCSSLLFSALLCSVDFPDEKCRFPDEKSRFPGEKKRWAWEYALLIPNKAGFALFDGAASSAQVAAVVVLTPADVPLHSP